MYPAVIDGFSSPCSIAEAIAEKARLGEGGFFLAGGMSAMQAIKARLLRPTNVVDLNNVVGLRGISIVGSEAVIGAMTRYREIAASPLLTGGLHALRDAAARVGDRQVRNRGTIGGSLCWNYVVACLPPTVLALGGIVHLASRNGRRAVPASEFLKGPLETSREEDELMVEIRFPIGARCGSAYKKWGLVTDALPVAGVAARLALDDHGTVGAASIVLAGLPTGPTPLHAAERGLFGVRRQDTALIRAVLADAAGSADTASDHAADADFRRALIASLGAEVVDTAFARAAGEM